jgi:hypothetical protein
MPVAPPSTPPKEPQKQVDLFKPEMPHIPGVGISGAAQSPRMRNLGVAAAAVVALGAFIVWRVKSNARTAVETTSSEVAIPAASEPVPEPAPPVPVPSDGSSDGHVQAATVEELSVAWASKKFVFVKPFTGDGINAIVIRLPGGTYWAFALQEPNGRCELEYVTDLQLLASQYQYRATHPMVVSPCSNTVYDPLKVGALGASIFVRGDIVKGSGLRPPISIDVEKSGDIIIADGIE